MIPVRLADDPSTLVLLSFKVIPQEEIIFGFLNYVYIISIYLSTCLDVADTLYPLLTIL